MALTLTPMDPSGRDRAELTAFLTANAFPFHVRARATTADVTRAIDDGAWDGDGTESFWLDDDDRGRVGVLRLDDVADPTAMIDVRLAETWRGHGLGAAALGLASAHVFATRPDVVRLEGQTREDNVAMLRAFERAGWVREATYRDGWPVEGAEPLASIAYSVLRRDHLDGRTTPVPRGPEVVLTGELRCADTGEEARVRAHLAEHIALTRAEPGCIAFDVEPGDEPGVWKVAERFVDEGAFDAHQRRIASSAWGAETAGIERRYEIRGRSQDADTLVAAAWAAEERLLDPAVRRVPAEVDRLLDDGFVEIGQSGRRWTKDAIVEALSADPGVAPGTVTERASRVLSPGTVLLEYVLRFDGRASRRSALWTFSPDPRCVFHQGTALG